MDDDHGVVQAHRDGSSQVSAGGTASGDATSLARAAREAVLGHGWHLMSSATVSRCVDAGPGAWERFAAHWEELVTDPYAAEKGTRRLRRYGQFLLSRDGEVAPLGHEAFVQPEDSNPLYVDIERHFEPLTEAFRAEPVLYALIRLLGSVAGGMGDAAEWIVRVHPFRVVAQADGLAQPTPEGRHKDGVDLVSSLLIGRANVTGGRSTVYAADGREIAATTLSEPGSLLLSDDRTTWHAVSPVRPQDTGLPGHRDVLVTTLTAR
ncbi:2OG-Fe dioxygenase family protein [Streptomyces sp. G44]|uniref:2OG-Fe dioxygenase family protein n=1 Tax=Streptomyces sp. G44 TaxID=2807632 RepID=UPI001960E2BE|nr:2OG-Fe dioxygenase family protein [Streptomyces sp. G44]MBM7167629.1 2OG-Fe dioxygenase family protein [Streptomyces sp. G44]